MMKDQGDIFNIDHRISAAVGISRHKVIPGAFKKKIVNMAANGDKVIGLLI